MSARVVGVMLAPFRATLARGSSILVPGTIPVAGARVHLGARGVLRALRAVPEVLVLVLEQARSVGVDDLAGSILPELAGAEAGHGGAGCAAGGRGGCQAEQRRRGEHRGQAARQHLLAAACSGRSPGHTSWVLYWMKSGCAADVGCPPAAPHSGTQRQAQPAPRGPAGQHRSYYNTI